MQSSTAALLVTTFLFSLLGCEVVRRVAIRRSLLDTVNERSLHVVPTPRLGGVAVVIAVVGAIALGGGASSANGRAAVIAASLLALVGLRDDLRPLASGLRFLVHIALASTFLAIVGAPPLLVSTDLAVPLPPLVVLALLVVWIVGLLNVYNFMDGMDGLAGAQAVFAAGTYAVILGNGSGLSIFALAIGAGCLGFLAHNAPPARIFLGDAGSTFLGMSFAALATLGLTQRVPITQTALPLAPFLLDGTFTIFRRALNKERFWKAHRSHLYQRAVQTGLGHRDVLLVYLCWMSCCSIGALACGGSGVGLVVGWTVAVLGLVLVRSWVETRERLQRTADA